MSREFPDPAYDPASPLHVRAMTWAEWCGINPVGFVERTCPGCGHTGSYRAQVWENRPDMVFRYLSVEDENCSACGARYSPPALGDSYPAELDGVDVYWSA